MLTTPNLSLKKPEDNDTVNIADLNYNADILDQEVAKRIINSSGVPSIQAGPDASKPTPGTAGRLYVATDTQIIYRDTGTAWQKVGVVKWGDIEGKPSAFLPTIHGNEAHDPDLALASDLAAHQADYVKQVGYATATGSANTYAVTLNPAPSALVDGLCVAVKINVDNTGASTLNVNGFGAKPIKKPNGNDVSAGNLKAGSIYTLRYNGTNFILQGEGGSGTAQPADVLSGKTFTNDTGEQIGTMTNNGVKTITPSNVDQALNGYYAAGSKVAAVTFDASKVLAGTTIAGTSGTMPNNGAVVITPGTANQAIPAGYHNGSGYVKGDANLVSANILSGISIFGVTGGATPKLFASGTATPSDNHIIVRGLSFKPKLIIITGPGSVSRYGCNFIYTADAYFSESSASGTKAFYGMEVYIRNDKSELVFNRDAYLMIDGFDISMIYPPTTAYWFAWN